MALPSTKEYTLGLYEKSMPEALDWPERLRAAKQAGYDYLEISVDESEGRLARLDMTSSQRLELLSASRSIGMPIDTMCLSGLRKYPLGSTDSGVYKRSGEIMGKAMELAAHLGIRIIQLAAYDVYNAEKSTAASKERFLQHLWRNTLKASGYGIILALETMENSFCDTVQKAMYYVNEVNSPYLKVYPDVGNITNAAQNPTLDIRSGKGHIAAVHLKESAPGIYRGLDFGDGHVDFATLIPVLMASGVRKYTAEFWDDSSKDWTERLKKSREFLTYFLNNKNTEV